MFFEVSVGKQAVERLNEIGFIFLFAELLRKRKTLGKILFDWRSLYM